MHREVSALVCESLASDWKAGHRAAVKGLLMSLLDLNSGEATTSEQQVGPSIRVSALYPRPWASLDVVLVITLRDVVTTIF